MNKSRQIIYMAVAVVLILAIAAANLLQWNNLGLLQKKLADGEYQLELARNRLLMLMNLQKQSEELEADYKALSTLLPYAGNEDSLILDMQSGADLSGMRFINIRIDDPLPGEGFWEIPLTMAFEGTYHQLLNFLDYLQVYERALRVDEILTEQIMEQSELLNINIRAGAFFAEDSNE